MKATISILQYAFYIFSAASSAAGILAVWFGLSLLPHLSFLNIDPVAVSVLSALGAAFAIINLLGLYGSMNGSYVPVVLHGIFHSGFFCISITTMLFFCWKLEGFINNFINNAFLDKFRHGFVITNSTMDIIQNTFECCGRTSFYDYLGEVPESCCFEKDCDDIMNLYTHGCINVVLNFWKDEFFYVRFGSASMVVLELLTVISSFAYGHFLVKKDDSYKDLLIAEVFY